MERGNAIAFGAVVVLVLGLIGIGAALPTTDRLDSSILGTRGLSYWIEENGHDTKLSNRRQRVNEEDVVLRVLALYDVDFRQQSSDPSNIEDRRATPTMRDIQLGVLQQKLDTTDTILLLPKWRAGALELNLLDSPLRVQTDDVNGALRQLDFHHLEIERPNILLLEENGLVLYRPQVFNDESVTGVCKPALSGVGGVLIAKCQRKVGTSVYLVSDPDLMTNHGLSLGDNAAIALDQINKITRGLEGSIYFDRSSEILLWSALEEEPEIPRRTAEDLARFLTYPFNIIFLSIALLFLIAFWRGLIRFGPPAVDRDESLGANKSASIEAKAHLLRLVGQDAALTKAFTAERLNDASRLILGEHRNRSDLFARLTKLTPTNATALSQIVDQIDVTGPETSPQHLMALATEFNTTYRRLMDELGHLSRNR